MDMGKLKKQLIMHEGLKLKPYRCTANKLTIGVGRNLDDNGITEQEAMVLLENDIERSRNECRSLFPNWRNLSENRQMVLIDMCFNLGLYKLSQFKNMIRAVNDELFWQASVEMQDSKWYNQVGSRGKNLVKMMIDG